ncbi:alpha-ketoglutarate-dependent dioxygenase AlkB family protein [Flavobacterium sp. U410]
MELFDRTAITLPLKDGVFEYHPNFFNQESANQLFKILLKETPWQQDDIIVFGKIYQQPRLTALYGNNGRTYGYSNIVMNPHPWTVPLTYIKEEIEKQTKLQFNAVLLNLYRNENDSNGWHADNEKELGPNPIIASVSLGEERLFQIKHNSNKSEKINLNIENGSLLLMKEGSQMYYKHQLPKSTKSKKPRINLTFRTIY